MTRSTRNHTARDRRRPVDRNRVRPRLEGLEDRCLLSNTITEFPVPTAGAGLRGITQGPDGNLWFTEATANKIGMIDPATHAIAEFPVPTASASPRWITAGPDGNLWLTEFNANKIGMINPATHAITEFPIPTGKKNTTTGPLGITAGSDGNLWFTEFLANQIGEINPTTHAITQFPIPTPIAYPEEGITAGPDGNLWFTDNSGGNIGMINPATHAITEFPVGVSTRGTTAGPDGNLWFTEPMASANKIGMINPATHALSEFPIPTASAYSLGITAGPDGNLWFTENASGKIGMINPTTQAITEYTIPYANTSPGWVAAGPDGNLWFTDEGANAIGVVTLDQTSNMHLAITQQPPASVTAGSAFGLTVQAEDSSNNPVASFSGTVTVGLASNPGGTALGGPVTVAASGGVATFSGLTLTKAASGYTLYVSGSGPISTTTSAITVTPASPTQLVVTQQPPSSVGVNTPFSMQTSIEDPYGNVVTTAAGTVSVAFANNPTGATLGGTLTVTTSGGVANFTNLTINKTGSGYTLQASSSGLSSAVTNAINVTKTGTSTALAAANTTTTPDLSLAPLVLDSPDLWDGLGFKKRSRSI
jgi:streptogramin lyase